MKKADSKIKTVYRKRVIKVIDFKNTDFIGSITMNCDTIKKGNIEVIPW